MIRKNLNIALLIIFLFTGCNYKTYKNGVEVKHNSSEKDIIMYDKKNSNVNYLIEKNKFYYKMDNFEKKLVYGSHILPYDENNKNLYIYDGIEIEYIQLTSCTGNNEFEEINNNLYKDIEEIVNIYGETNNFSMTLQNIFYNENLLSINFKCGVWDAFMISPKILHYYRGLNMDFKENKELQLTDIIINMDKLYDLLIEGKYEIGNQTISEEFEKLYQFQYENNSSRKEIIYKLSSIHGFWTDNPYSWHLRENGQLIICRYIYNYPIEYVIKIENIKDIVNPKYYKDLLYGYIE